MYIYLNVKTDTIMNHINVTVAGLDPPHHALAEQPPDRQLACRLPEEAGGLPYLQVRTVFKRLTTC